MQHARLATYAMLKNINPELAQKFLDDFHKANTSVLVACEKTIQDAKATWDSLPVEDGKVNNEVQHLIVSHCQL
jgi:hypothetical protein